MSAIQVVNNNNSFEIPEEVFSVLQDFDEFVGFRKSNSEFILFTELEWALFIENIKKRKNIPDWKWDIVPNRSVSDLKRNIWLLKYYVKRKGKKMHFQKKIFGKIAEGKKITISFRTGMEKVVFEARKDFLEILGGKE